MNVPGCPVQPDNFMETLLYLLYQVAGLAPMIPLDDQLRPKWLFGATVHDGCDRAGYYEQGDFAEEYGSPKCLVKDRLLGTGRELQRPEARLDGMASAAARTWAASASAARCPGFPDKFMPFMDEPPGATLSTAASLAFMAAPSVPFGPSPTTP